MTTCTKQTTPNSNTAVEFTRPLLYTPAQDMTGHLARSTGRLILFLITCVSVLVVFLIFAFVIRQAIPFLARHGWRELLTSTHWFPEATSGHAEFGALALIVGSLYVTAAALVLSAPIGLLAAIFLSDIAPFKIQQICKPVIEILAAIPSVSYGFFAVMILAPWMQQHWGFSTGTNALNAALVLAVMALPTIISIAQDSLSAVGREIREASYALGATRAETIIKVILPAADSGIIAGIILGIMRAMGETMVVWMASGNASQIPHPWWDLSQSIRTMTATIAGELGETPKNTDHYFALFAVGLLLLTLSFTLNLVSEHFLMQSKKRRKPGRR